MRIGDDLTGDAASGRSDDGLIRIGDDDSIAPTKANTRPPIPSQFHAVDSCIAHCTPDRPPGSTEAHDCVRQPSPARKKEWGACPIGAPLGGREDGTLRVRSMANASPVTFSDNREVD